MISWGYSDKDVEQFLGDENVYAQYIELKLSMVECYGEFKEIF